MPSVRSQMDRARAAWDDDTSPESPGAEFGLAFDPTAYVADLFGKGDNYRRMIRKSGREMNRTLSSALGTDDRNGWVANKPVSTIGLMAGMYYGGSALGGMGNGGASAGGGSGAPTGGDLGVFSNGGQGGMTGVGQGGNMGNLVRANGGTGSVMQQGGMQQLQQQQMPQQQQEQEQQRPQRTAYTPATVPQTGGVGERPDPISYRRLMMARAMGA